MQARDLDAVVAISTAVHREYAEPAAVYAERLRLFPAGCFIIGAADEVGGFLVSHPWRGPAPALGAMLGSLPIEPTSYYLHHIALRPEMRGSNAGGAAMRLIERAAKAAACSVISLVAVHGAERYWARHGFEMAGPGGYDPGTYLMRRPV